MKIIQRFYFPVYYNIWKRSKAFFSIKLRFFLRRHNIPEQNIGKTLQVKLDVIIVKQRIYKLQYKCREEKGKHQEEDEEICPRLRALEIDLICLI